MNIYKQNNMKSGQPKSQDLRREDYFFIQSSRVLDYNQNDIEKSDVLRIKYINKCPLVNYLNVFKIKHSILHNVGILILDIWGNSQKA